MPCGSVAQLGAVNVKPLSVPASSGSISTVTESIQEPPTQSFFESLFYILLNCTICGRTLIYLKRIQTDKPIGRRHDAGGQRHHRMVSVQEEFRFTASAATRNRWQCEFVKNDFVVAPLVVESVASARFDEIFQCRRCRFAEAKQIVWCIMWTTCDWER